MSVRRITRIGLARSGGVVLGLAVVAAGALGACTHTPPPPPSGTTPATNAAVASVARASGSVATSSGAPFADTSFARVIVTSMADVQDVAIAPRTVFVAARDALGIYDRIRRDWLAPIGVPDGYVPRQPLAMMADPREDAVWIATADTVSRYTVDGSPPMHARVPGEAREMMFDLRAVANGVLVRTPSGWLQVNRAGAVRPVDATQLPPPESRVERPTTESLLRRHPALATASSLTRDESDRTYRTTGIAESPGGEELWIGTAGNGVFRLDPRSGRAIHELFGPPETPVGALAMESAGLWIAGASRSPNARAALAYSAPSLGGWQWVEAGLSRLAGARPLSMTVDGRNAWLATDLGVARASLRDRSPLRYWNSGNGLPSDVTYAVAPAPTGAWVGTTSGVMWIPEQGAVRPAARPLTRGTIRPPAVRALALCGDTLWVGSDSGLFVMQPATPSNPMRAYSSGSDPVLDARIVALVAHDSVLAVASEKSVELVNRRTGRIIARPAAADYSTLGGISSIALDERALWVGGRNGVMMLIRDSRTVRSLRAPSQIPGPVTALALSLNAGWIGTPDGLVRMRRAADGGAP